MKSASRYAKAIAAFVSAFAVPFAGALTETSDHGNIVTQGEWITALVAGLVGGFAVAAIPNRPPAGQPSDPGVSEQGHVDLAVVLVAVAAAVVVLAVYTLI